ncbi:MAG: cytochrome C [Candidatus Manganitrophaceae bacterium]|nr:MAG: cytochrome C [Candidatus Manganitrophaceae bacterium]
MARASRLLLLILLLVLGATRAAPAIDILKGIMPGKVSALHEKVEGSCLECHVLGQKQFFEKCLACHKEVQRDIEGKKSFHGKIDAPRCETCHAEHKGRENSLIDFKKEKFDHTQAEFSLVGKHRQAECAGCHLKHKYRETPRDCFSCHVKKDKHEGGLGKACERCHTSDGWKEIKFDHSKTRFLLEGKHQTVGCEKCHAAAPFSSTPTTCVGCHQKEDKHKGVLGRQCENCHTAAAWKKILFDHNKTEFKLIGRHQEAPCLKCHKSPQLKETPKVCFSCHQKEDRHKGVLGRQCESCHSAEGWKKILFDHDQTRFRLIGSHREAPCLKCHQTPQLRETPKACFECHRKEDRHKGKLGQECDRCHVAEKWKRITFDHAATKYPLIGKHITVPCATCHAEERYKISSECSTCHRKDDKHQGKLGDSCDRCHVEKAWKEIQKFDHRKTRFPLLGKHEPIRCARCHPTLLFKDVSSVCVDCHREDDYHRGSFGAKCEFCHAADDWKRQTFDHVKETGYPLVEKHSKIKCGDCHRKPLFSQKTSRQCVQCHRRDDPHDGELGARCEICHTTVGFKVIKKISSEKEFIGIARFRRTTDR